MTELCARPALGSNTAVAGDSRGLSTDVGALEDAREVPGVRGGAPQRHEDSETDAALTEPNEAVSEPVPARIRQPGQQVGEERDE